MKHLETYSLKVQLKSIQEKSYFVLSIIFVLNDQLDPEDLDLVKVVKVVLLMYCEYFSVVYNIIIIYEKLAFLDISRNFLSKNFIVCWD